MKKDSKKWVPASVKVAAIADYKSKAMSLKSVAQKYKVCHVSILNWTKEKDLILQECRESAKLFPVFDSVTGNSRRLSLQEEPMPKGNSRESLLAEIKALRQEKAFLADKVAYLEALATEEGRPVADAAKKKGLRQSESPSKVKEAPM
jgi:transposase-like protein